MKHQNFNKRQEENSLQSDIEMENREQEYYLNNMQQVDNWWPTDEDRLDHVKRAKWDMLDNFTGI